MPHSFKQAFSLIEVLFAVGIVAIVMSLMVAHMSHLRRDALVKIAQSQQPRSNKQPMLGLPRHLPDNKLLPVSTIISTV
jgi:prepilin-type N-terminal cleavage/methylation domain-containing protein